MKKQKIQLIIMAIILVLLAVFFFLVKKTDIFKEKEEEKVTYKLIDASKDDVIGISYYVEDTLVTLKKIDEKWVVEGDEAINLDQDSVANIISTATSISSDTFIDSSEGLSEYGLDPAQNTITLMLSNGSSERYYIGDMEGMSYKYYARTDKDDKIYLVSSTYSSAVAQSIENITAEETVEETAEETAEETETTENN